MADLLSALHARLTSKFGGDAAKALNAAGTGEAATRELRLLLPSRRTSRSATQAQQLLELFLPYLRLKPTPRAERVKEQVLRLVGGLLPLLERPELHLRFFGQMFAQLRARGGRAALCDLWTRLAALPATAAAADLGEIGAVAAALNELNAFDGASVDELDYERRVSGYAALPPLVNRAPPPLLLPLLANAIHDVERDDIALRHSATHTITLLARRAAAEPPPADGTPPTGVRGLLERVLMPALRRHLRLPPERNTLFVEALKLLGSTLLLLPALQPDLATLLSPAEPEADFFYNITHVQMPAASARSHGSAHASTAAPSRSRRSLALPAPPASRPRRPRESERGGRRRGGGGDAARRRGAAAVAPLPRDPPGVLAAAHHAPPPREAPRARHRRRHRRLSL